MPNAYHKSLGMTTITGEINVVGSCLIPHHKTDTESRVSTKNIVSNRHHRSTK